MGTQREFTPGLAITIGAFGRQAQRDWHPFEGANSGGGAAPVITKISPEDGPISRYDVVVIDVTCASGLAFIVFSVLLGEINVDELIYKTGTGFTGKYVGSSNTIENITNGFRFRLLRAGGWPVGTDEFSADAVSATGELD